VTIEYTELANNGLGDACVATSCVHNVYVGTGGAGNYAKLIFRFNWTHALATDTADKGHLLKSRALESDILYNRITGESGHDSYEIDLPNGGLGIVVGNVIEKGPNPDNKILLAYGEEGYGSGTNNLYVVNNTFVNDDAVAGATFINVANGGTLSAAHNNLFVGMGTLSSTGALSADNLSTTTPMFVNAAGYDYHLQQASPAIGVAVAPGSAGATSLVPTFEYVHPIASTARATAHDLGAFEFGTMIVAGDGGAGSDTDSGAQTGGGDASTGGSGGAGAGGNGASPSGNDGGAGETAPTSNSGGCGCRTTSAHDVSNLFLLVAVVSTLAFVRRRRRR
jgi:MYXO-CTERM domain-containing protein